MKNNIVNNSKTLTIKQVASKVAIQYNAIKKAKGSMIETLKAFYFDSLKGKNDATQLTLKRDLKDALINKGVSEGYTKQINGYLSHVNYAVKHGFYEGIKSLNMVKFADEVKRVKVENNGTTQKIKTAKTKTEANKEAEVENNGTTQKIKTAKTKTEANKEAEVDEVQQLLADIYQLITAVSEVKQMKIKTQLKVILKELEK